MQGVPTYFNTVFLRGNTADLWVFSLHQYFLFPQDIHFLEGHEEHFLQDLDVVFADVGCLGGGLYREAVWAKS